MILRNWLHRKGIARLINSGSNSMNDQGTAFIQARGPRWLAVRLARHVLRASAYCRPDLQTIRVTDAQQPERFTWRFQFAFRRLPLTSRTREI